ncbi:putative Qb-SNARE protein [Trypanosoma grayi]|uniref:putative Qb-SNARE protein n=1 Tax=Trypanosoma grayi TaxID=71804 RepID=UPI0004F426A6|nr:putative Qb-SNARE protein [Trypanosoma grayi]KEG12234.1 putative Qb-SNARE protein [Trypanosoma grayi]
MSAATRKTAVAVAAASAAEAEPTTEKEQEDKQGERAAYDELQRRLVRLSKYKQAEYYCVEGIATLRQSLREVVRLEGDAGSDNSSARSELARARQDARRAHQQLDRLTKEAQRAARRGGTADEADLKELLHHVESARLWYRDCFRVVLSHERQPQRHEGAVVEGSAHPPARHSPVDLSTPLLAANGAAPSITVSDEEFRLFADQVRRNDDLADATLDRIALGLSRLHENAVHMTAELSAQEQILHEVGGKVGTTHTKLGAMNTRLRKVLAKNNKCDFCMYAFCCVLLVGVVVAIAILLKS